MAFILIFSIITLKWSLVVKKSLVGGDGASKKQKRGLTPFWGKWRKRGQIPFLNANPFYQHGDVGDDADFSAEGLQGVEAGDGDVEKKGV